MNEAQHTLSPDRDTGAHRKRAAQGKRARVVVRGMLYLVILTLCGVIWWQITLRGYEMAKAYIDQSVSTVRQENAVNIQALQSRIDLLSQEMEQLRDSLDSAGSTISNSASVQERIDNRLETLDNQLKALENSLKILKEAP